MNVYSYKLVSHFYDEQTLREIYSPNCIKAPDNKFGEKYWAEHPIANEIEMADFVYSIQNISNPKDEYGFCYGSEIQLQSGNFCYKITAFILDSNLPESIVKDFASSVAEFLNQTNRQSAEDCLRIDRLYGFEIHPLSFAFISNTADLFSDKVVEAFKSAKQGLTYIDACIEKRLKDIACKMV